MQEMQAGMLVRALMLVLLSRDLTDSDKRRVSSFLDGEIAGLIASGKQEDAAELAKLAVKQAVRKLRQSQGVASRTAQRREILRRTGALQS